MSSLYQKRGIFYYQGKDEDGNLFQKPLRTRDREEEEEESEAGRAVLRRYALYPDEAGGGLLGAPPPQSRAGRTFRTHRGHRRVCAPAFSGLGGAEHGTVFSDQLGLIDFSAFKEARLVDGVSPTTAGNNLRHIQSSFVMWS